MLLLVSGSVSWLMQIANFVLQLFLCSAQVFLNVEMLMKEIINSLWRTDNLVW